MEPAWFANVHKDESAAIRQYQRAGFLITPPPKETGAYRAEGLSRMGMLGVYRFERVPATQPAAPAGVQQNDGVPCREEE